MSETTERNALQCPKCDGLMRELKADEIMIDRCEKCYGIWLDKGERVKILKDASLVAGADIGTKEQGEAQNEVTEIDCPRCAKPMQHVADRGQKHIGFEFCRECQGSYFDAGELTDLKDFKLSERIKAIFGR